MIFSIAHKIAVITGIADEFVYLQNFYMTFQTDFLFAFEVAMIAEITNTLILSFHTTPDIMLLLCLLGKSDESVIIFFTICDLTEKLLWD